MRALAVGDLVRDNLGRKGIVIERARKPDSKWLAAQDDRRMRGAVGPWWHVVPLDGGDALVPEDFAKRIRRATVDDVVKLMESDTTDSGRATLQFLFAGIRSSTSRYSKGSQSLTSGSKPTRPKRRAV